MRYVETVKSGNSTLWSVLAHQGVSAASLCGYKSVFTVSTVETVINYSYRNKAETEYKKYKAKTLSSVERDYLNSIKALEQKAKQEK